MILMSWERVGGRKLSHGSNSLNTAGVRVVSHAHKINALWSSLHTHEPNNPVKSTLDCARSPGNHFVNYTFSLTLTTAQ